MNPTQYKSGVEGTTGKSVTFGGGEDAYVKPAVLLLGLVVLLIIVVRGQSGF